MIRITAMNTFQNFMAFRDFFKVVKCTNMRLLLEISGPCMTSRRIGDLVCVTKRRRERGDILRATASPTARKVHAHCGLRRSRCGHATVGRASRYRLVIDVADTIILLPPQDVACSPAAPYVLRYSSHLPGVAVPCPRTPGVSSWQMYPGV